MPPSLALWASLRAMSCPSEAERYWLTLAKMPRVIWPVGESSMFSVAEMSFTPTESISTMTKASSMRFRFSRDSM
ncbi:hypothetical protein VV02_23925 [Luteipulveratus mongoliensis]|uniref:Uncharacterized protein n=1 Tax=Luteipulveratus mongoliensis TaxID=571913 RepID=A0A0K1JN92_9MICO|nr:hypothetical protein VV02_23925 [Luteipulveratus mongoliensis]